MALNAKATQDFVPIKEVRDGIVMLKDGGMRAILIGSSVNLSLKSYEEQQAIIMQFQTFLNSLEFSTQIVVQSRRLDIRPYLLLLENRMKEQTEPLLKVQTKEYMDFIQSFTEQVNIMTKNFFIVVPYSTPQSSTQKDLLKSFLPFGKKNTTGDARKDAAAEFEEKRTQLQQRVGVVQQGLSRIGVRTVQLGTEEVVELFYKTFNPGDTSQGIKLEGVVGNK
jgi:hypothetical protein